MTNEPLLRPFSHRSAASAAAALLTVCVASGAHAEEPAKTEFIMTERAVDKDGDERKDGLDWRVSAGSTLNFSNNRNVVGQVDGSTLTFGFKHEAGMEYRRVGHEWRNKLTAAAGMSATPAAAALIKSHDTLQFETIYLYHVTDWFGPFARFAWDTQMFRGMDVQAAPVAYSIARLDGTTQTVVDDRLHLTDALRPSFLKESVGLFAQPVSEKLIALEIRAGAGGRHALAAGQLAVSDDDTTADIREVKELDDVHQLGAEAIIEVWGTYDETRIVYKLLAEAMMPFVYSDLPPGDDRSSFELTNINLEATLGIKLVSWATLDYAFRARREAQLIDTFQIQNQLLLTFGMAVGGGPSTATAATK